MLTKSQEEKIKKRDNYTCQFDKIIKLSENLNEPCSKELVVHYKNPNPKNIEDGITVCKRCKWFLDGIISAIKTQKKETN